MNETTAFRAGDDYARSRDFLGCALPKGRREIGRIWKGHEKLRTAAMRPSRRGE